MIDRSLFVSAGTGQATLGIATHGKVSVFRTCPRVESEQSPLITP
jgi:hypothetical protein